MPSSPNIHNSAGMQSWTPTLLGCIDLSASLILASLPGSIELPTPSPGMVYVSGIIIHESLKEFLSSLIDLMGAKEHFAIVVLNPVTTMALSFPCCCCKIGNQ